MRQSWSLFIKFRGFQFSSPSGFNTTHAFKIRFHVLQKRIAKILLPILTSCSLWYQYVKKLHRVPYLAFGTNFFPKITTAKRRQRQIFNYVMRIQRLHKLKYHCRFWYCLACCILYSTKSTETSMKQSASAHISLKYRQRIFYSLLRAYCFPIIV